MTQYGTPTIGDRRVGRSQGAGVPGVSESLGSPGLVNTPLTESEGQKAYQELSSALGMAGSDIDQYGTAQLQNAQREARFQAHADQIDHAKAVEHAEMMLPDLDNQIQEGKITIDPDIDGKSQTGPQAERLARQFAGEGEDAYGKSLRRALAPHLAVALSRERDKKLNTAAIDTAKDRRALLYTSLPDADPYDASRTASQNPGTKQAAKEASDLSYDTEKSSNADAPPVSKWRPGVVPDNIPEILDKAVADGVGRLTRDQVVALSLMPAIRMAAKNGDPDAINKLSQYVPDAFANDVDNAKFAAERAVGVRQSQQAKAAQEYIANPKLAAMLGDGDFTTAVDHVLRSKDAGLLSSDQAITELKSIEALSKETNKQNDAQVERVQDALFEQQTVANLNHWIAQGRSESSVPPEVFDRLRPNGTVQHMEPKKVFQMAVQSDFNDIDKATQDKAQGIKDLHLGPDSEQKRIADAQTQSTAMKVRRLERGGSDYEPWSKSLSALPELATKEMLAQPGALATDIQAAVSLRDSIPDELAYRLMNPKAAPYYHDLDATRTFITGNGQDRLRAALIETENKRSKDHINDASSHVDPKKLNDAVDSAFPQATNKSFALGEVKTLAKYYMERFNAPDDQALAKATETIKTSTKNMNGYLISTLGKYVPQDLDKISPMLMQEFADRHPELGTADQFTLRPYGDNSWMVVKGEHADSFVTIPVSTFPDDGLYTSDQIEKMRPGLMARHAAEEKAQHAKAAEEIARRPELKMFITDDLYHAASGASAGPFDNFLPGSSIADFLPGSKYLEDSQKKVPKK